MQRCSWPQNQRTLVGTIQAFIYLAQEYVRRCFVGAERLMMRKDQLPLFIAAGMTHVILLERIDFFAVTPRGVQSDYVPQTVGQVKGATALLAAEPRVC